MSIYLLAYDGYILLKLAISLITSSKKQTLLFLICLFKLLFLLFVVTLLTTIPAISAFTFSNDFFVLFNNNSECYSYFEYQKSQYERKEITKLNPIKAIPVV